MGSISHFSAYSRTLRYFPSLVCYDIDANLVKRITLTFIHKVANFVQNVKKRSEMKWTLSIHFDCSIIPKLASARIKLATRGMGSAPKTCIQMIIFAKWSASPLSYSYHPSYRSYTLHIVKMDIATRSSSPQILQKWKVQLVIRTKFLQKKIETTSAARYSKHWFNRSNQSDSSPPPHRS